MTKLFSKLFLAFALSCVLLVVSSCFLSLDPIGQDPECSPSVSCSQGFTCVSGFCEVNNSSLISQRVYLHQSGNYWAFENGSTYTMNGINLYGVGYKYPRDMGIVNNQEFRQWLDGYFQKLADHDINYVRFFLKMYAQWDLNNHDWDEEYAQRTDIVFDLAQKHGIMVTPAIFNENWDWNSARDGYNAWTDEESKEFITAVVERWGDEPALAFWDLCNDIQYKRSRSVVELWLNEMESHLRTVDNNSHPIMVRVLTGNSLANNANYQHMLDNVDALSVRAYESNIDGMVNVLHNRISADIGNSKPVFVGEFRSKTSATNPADTPTSLGTMRTLWMAYTSGASGVHPWTWTPDSIEPATSLQYPLISEDELDYFKAVQKVVSKIGLAENQFQPSNIVTSNDPDIEIYSISTTNRVFAYLWNDKEWETNIPTVSIDALSSGTYTVEWINQETGNIILTTTTNTLVFNAPSFSDGIVLNIYPSNN